MTTVGLGDLVPSGHAASVGDPLGSRQYFRSMYTIFSASEHDVEVSFKQIRWKDMKLK